MKLIFPFKNLAANGVLGLLTEREDVLDYILIKMDEYPFSENYFDKRIENVKERFADFENEILQTINTTDQTTIDAYFSELLADLNNIKYHLRKRIFIENVNSWNQVAQKEFEEKVERESKTFFESSDRKRKHLEKYEVTVGPSLFDFSFGYPGSVKKFERVNYDFYCIEEKPELIDFDFIDSYLELIQSICNEFNEIAVKYGKPYSNGEIISNLKNIRFIKPIVFVEGEHDITYINKAAEHLDRQELLKNFDLRQRGGYKNLDKLWEIFRETSWETIPQKKLLLYDCDTNIVESSSGYIYKRVIKLIPENIIVKGIENLFPTSLIEKALEINPAFIDLTIVKRRKRGIESEETIHIVNEDEKKKFCNWICENGSKEDFKHFNDIFKTIEELLFNE